MPAQIIDGKALAATCIAHVADAVRDLARSGPPPRLAAVLVGDPHASHIYADKQRKRCEELGIGYELVHLPEVVAGEPAGVLSLQNRLLGEIRRLNADLSVTGIMLHLPLPAGVDTPRLQYEIDPFKDVEGVNPANLGFIFYDHPLLLPCTALGVIELIRSVGVPLRGAEAVVVGQSGIVGKPVASLLVREMATVTGCHIATRDLAAHTRRADILVVAVGKANLITADMVKPGAVVIDVGINHVKTTTAGGKVESRTVGDCAPSVAEAAGFLTPVPGGVGPMTVAMLMRNTVEAVRKQRARAE